MKKVLLLSLSLALGFSAFAQQRVAKNDSRAVKVDSRKVIVGNEAAVQSAAAYAPQTAKSVVINRYQEVEDAATMYTFYDLQSNSWCSNRMYQLPNGNVGVTATMSHESNQQATDRGTGYNFYNGSEWLEEPEERVEPFRCGWPTIAQYGATGEVLVSHAPVHCFIREVAGEGEWIDMGELPAHPEGYPYTDDLAWPRIATSGENHNIIHLIADIQHSVSSEEVVHHQVYYRSEDGGQTWITAYSPLAQDGEETGHYTADSYNISACGHTVAMIYGDDLQGHVVMYKSNDDGQTWERTVIWENPYYGYDWATDPQSVFTDTVFGPANLAIAVDRKGVAHVALTAYEYIHDEIGDTYTTWSGRGVDGVYYWNDTQEAPIQSIDGNPHHALRLWWPDEENPGYVKMNADSTKWIGYVPLYQDEDGNLIAYDNDKFYRENDYFYKFRSGQSADPAFSIDPMGNIACAWSAPCSKQDDENDPYYYRHIYVSYLNVDEGYWHQVWDELSDPEIDFAYYGSENIYTVGVDNTANPGEFWFAYQSDDEIGLYWGSNATQTSGSQNDIHAVKVIADPELVSVPESNVAQDVVYGIYPNPATDYVIVKSAQDAEATITLYNLVGQTVKQFNQSLKLGENVISIDLQSGIYFCNINANGFSKTVKFVVK